MYIYKTKLNVTIYDKLRTIHLLLFSIKFTLIWFVGNFYSVNWCVSCWNFQGQTGVGKGNEFNKL